MLKIGLCGLGRMGSYHLSVYERLLDEGFPIEVTAICDVERSALDGTATSTLNLTGTRYTAKRKYALFTSLDDMLSSMRFDVVDVIVPTYLHHDHSIKVLQSGANCLCEKPMALNIDECQDMIKAADKSNKLLMIGHCLRFWREYAWLYDAIKDGRFGKVLGAYFTRGGYAGQETSPSWHDWIIDASLGGGALFDQHIHDTDFILWAFGEPADVHTTGKKYFPRSANDIVSTQYIYDDKIITALDDISYRALPFEYGYTVNFEKAAVTYRENTLTVYPENGEKYRPDLALYGDSNAYYNEIKYFLNCVAQGKKPDRCDVHDALATIRLVRLEEQSAAKSAKQ